MKLVKNIYFSVREIWKASRSALFFLIFLAGFSAFFTICDVIYIKYLIDYALCCLGLAVILRWFFCRR